MREADIIFSLLRFLKVGNTPKGNNSTKIGSWRQNMLKNVAVPEQPGRNDDSMKLLPTKSRKSWCH